MRPLQPFQNQVRKMVEHTATDVLKFTKEVSNALLKVRPLGGSELFVKRFGDYFADPVYCGEMIEDTHRRLHAAHISRVKAERELEATSARIAALEGALGLALAYMARFEPKDSRAVSDEFVAMAAIHSGDYSESVMRVIDAALQKEGESNE